ncbi:MAG: hypothetical protein ACR2N5_04360 [Solirubrobacterales bacterium]
MRAGRAASSSWSVPAAVIAAAALCALLAGLLVATASTSSPAVALAGERAGASGSATKYGTKLRISERFPAFHGRVKSSAPECLDRVVKLFEARFGKKNKKLGRDRTNSKGKWRVILDPLTTGSYYAKVPKSRGTDESGDRYVCKKDRSKTVFVD